MALPVEPGAVVRLRGLQAAGGRLNDSLGVVLSRHVVAQDSTPADPPESLEAVRWVVQIIGAESEKPVAVRQSNLCTARHGPAWLQVFLGATWAASVVVAAMAHAAGPGSLICGLAPVCSLIWFFATVATCYWLHSPICANGVLFPAISEMGLSSVARLVYRVGFGLCGFLLATTVLELRALASQQNIVSTSDGQDWAPSDPGIGWGLAAAGGVALQGICTLRLTFGLETVAHLGGAVLVMSGTMQHATQSNAWFTNLPTGSPLLRQGLGSWGLWLRRDAVQHAMSSGSGGIFLLFLLPLLAQAGGRLGMGTSGHAMENATGLMQWLIVSGVALYFCTYTLDLMALSD